MAQFDLPLAELRSFAPAVRTPADFDEFWRDTIADARAAGGEVEAIAIEPALPHVEVSDVTFPGFGGQPVKAWYSRPAAVAEDLPVHRPISGLRRRPRAAVRAHSVAIRRLCAL